MDGARDHSYQAPDPVGDQAPDHVGEEVVGNVSPNRSRSRARSPAPSRKRDHSESTDRTDRAYKRHKKHKKHKKHSHRSNRDDSSSRHSDESTKSASWRRRRNDSNSTISYGPGSSTVPSQSTSRDRELIQLRDLVKKQNIPRYPDEFSFSPSEAQSIAHSFVSNEQHIDSPPPPVSEPLSLEDVIFEGVSKEPKGKPLGQVSIKLIDDWFARDVDPEFIKKLRDLYPEPENTEHLSPKGMNPEIYRPLPENLKKRDFCAKMVQSNIVAAATATFRLIDTLMSHKDKLPVELNKDLAKFAADGAKLLGKATTDLSVLRKQLVRGQLDKKYGVLCAQRCYTKQLFGDDLNQALKEADDMSKLSRTIARPQQSSKPFVPKPATQSRPKDRFLYQNKGQSQQRQSAPYQPRPQQQRPQNKPGKGPQNQKA